MCGIPSRSTTLFDVSSTCRQAQDTNFHRNKPREKLKDALQIFNLKKNEPSISFVHVILRILCVFDDKECGSHVMFWKAQKSFRGIRRVRLNYFFDSSHTHWKYWITHSYITFQVQIDINKRYRKIQTVSGTYDRRLTVGHEHGERNARLLL